MCLFALVSDHYEAKFLSFRGFHIPIHLTSAPHFEKRSAEMNELIQLTAVGISHEIIYMRKELRE